jgi:hypothetical protein
MNEQVKTSRVASSAAKSASSRDRSEAVSGEQYDIYRFRVRSDPTHSTHTFIWFFIHTITRHHRKITRSLTRRYSSVILPTLRRQTNQVSLSPSIDK